MKNAKLLINSKLEIRPFDHSENLQIPLKQGSYSYIVSNGGVIINSDKEPIDINNVKWEFFGEDGYYSHESSFCFVSIQDKKNNNDHIINPYTALDMFENFKAFDDGFSLFEIPPGNAGGYYIYVAKNEKGLIVAVYLTSDEPDYVCE